MSSTSEHTCDVLVVGGGPAGIAAAVRAAETGAKVILADDNGQAGGQIWRGVATGKCEATFWRERLRGSGVGFLPFTRVVAQRAPDVLLAENPEGAVRIRSSAFVLATGARELFLPFPGWTLPNVVGVGGLQALVKSGLPIAGKRVVITGSGPLLLAVAAFLKRKGARIKGIFEQSSRRRIGGFAMALLGQPATLWEAAKYGARTELGKYHFGWWADGAVGKEKVESVMLTNGVHQRSIACDYLACGFHLTPNCELAAALGIKIVAGSVAVDETQRTTMPGIYSAGEMTGVAGLKLALVEGQIAGLCAAGDESAMRRLLPVRARLRQFAERMNTAFALREELHHLVKPETIICRCEDVRWEIVRGYASMRSAKVHTRCGMGPCQGRVCGAALRFLLGWEMDSARPPLYPVRISTLLPDAVYVKEEI